MTDTITLTAQAGYTFVACPTKHQKGKRVERVAWLEQSEQRDLRRRAKEMARLIKKADVETDDMTPEQLAEQTAAEEAIVASVYELLTLFLPRWEFVDRTGAPLPQPVDGPGVLDKLDSETLEWLTPGTAGSVWEDVLPNAQRSAP